MDGRALLDHHRVSALSPQPYAPAGHMDVSAGPAADDDRFERVKREWDAANARWEQQLQAFEALSKKTQQAATNLLSDPAGRGTLAVGRPDLPVAPAAPAAISPLPGGGTPPGGVESNGGRARHAPLPGQAASVLQLLRERTGELAEAAAEELPPPPASGPTVAPLPAILMAAKSNGVQRPRAVSFRGRLSQLGPDVRIRSVDSEGGRPQAPEPEPAAHGARAPRKRGS